MGNPQAAFEHKNFCSSGSETAACVSFENQWFPNFVMGHTPPPPAWLPKFFIPCLLKRIIQNSDLYDPLRKDQNAVKIRTVTIN